MTEQQAAEVLEYLDVFQFIFAVIAVALVWIALTHD